MATPSSPDRGRRPNPLNASDETVDVLRQIAAAGGGEDEIRAAVDVARTGGVSWQSIGAALGLNRGAAYQRYRHRADRAVQDDS